VSLKSTSALDSIIHPLLMGSIARFTPATVTVQSVALVNTGGVVSETWGNVSGLLSLPCRIVVDVLPSSETRENDPNITVTKVLYNLVITGYYNTITTQMRAIVTTKLGNSLTLDILEVAHDGQDISTRLVCELVSI
jgi:hypothetical protein